MYSPQWKGVEHSTTAQTEFGHFPVKVKKITVFEYEEFYRKKG